MSKTVTPDVHSVARNLPPLRESHLVPQNVLDVVEEKGELFSEDADERKYRIKFAEMEKKKRSKDISGSEVKG